MSGKGAGESGAVRQVISENMRIGHVVRGLVGLLAFEVLVATLDFFLPPEMTRAEQASPVVLDRRGAWLRALPVENGRWRIRADLARTDLTFQQRLIAIEDRRFWSHPGVDPFALARAIGSAVVHGRPTSGASTLTMQTARLLEPRRRTLAAKIIELFRSLQIEARLSKPDLLALYLTLTPYGGNLEGVRAASLSYFGHEPQSLTLGEQALLIALPQSPESRRPDRRPEAARRARRDVLDKMARAKLITEVQALEADGDPLPTRAPFPALAWHAAGELARSAPKGQASVISTLDASLQSRLEPLAARVARAQGPGDTSAILVIDIPTRGVRAAVGSGGLDRQGGWIDMTLAVRSPGSSLKPFIYGLAFDDGIAAPDTVLDDAPRRFADYQPENFDRVFHGKVSAREALSHSLNVPAVALLQKIDPASFEARLAAADVSLVRPKSQTRTAGLALALGGVGITLRDLATLYAALGDNGVVKPLAWTRAEAVKRQGQTGKRLMAAKAAQQVLDILRETPPPAGVTASVLTKSRPLMAFKTGTSYGFRDAVAAGVVGRYAIVVWTGRADGGARGGLTGRDSALPLLFDVADLLDAPANAPRPIAPRQAPQGLATLQRIDDGPRLIFPPDSATVRVEAFGANSRGLVLAAGGENLSWYVDGVPLSPDSISGRVVWRPPGAGFYRLVVSDDQGRRVKAKVRILGN